MLAQKGSEFGALGLVEFDPIAHGETSLADQTGRYAGPRITG